MCESLLFGLHILLNKNRIDNALDKLEAVMQHNQADLSTWIELEYDI
jgi:hypothetical protein